MGRAAVKGGLALLLLLIVVGLAGCGAPPVDAGWSALTSGTSQLYVGLGDGKFSAIDPASANAAWQYADKDRLGGFYGAPTVAEGRVIFAAADATGRASKAYSLNVETGQDSQLLVDSKELIIGAPAVYGDTVYITSVDGNVYASGLTGGDKRVLVKADGPIWGSVVREGDLLYFGTMGHSVYAVDPSGAELWRFETQAAVPGTPAVSGGRVYVGDMSGRVYALDAQTGKPVWAAPFVAPNWMWGQPVLVGDTLYAPSLDGNVYALDAATGAEKTEWRISTGGAVSARPTLVGDTMYVASESGFLHAVDVTAHKDRWAPFKTEGQLLTSPVVVDNAIYVSTSNGKVYVVDAATGNGRQLYPQPK